MHPQRPKTMSRSEHVLFCPNTAIQQGRCRTTRLDSLVAAASADKIMEVVEAHGERGGEVAVVEGIPVEHADAGTMCAAPLGPQIGARMACLRPSAAQHHPHMLNQRCPARTGGRSIICLAHSRVEHAQFTTQSSRIHSAHAARICLFPTSCGGTERLRMLARSNELENVPDAPQRAALPTHNKRPRTWEYGLPQASISVEDVMHDTQLWLPLLEGAQTELASPLLKKSKPGVVRQARMRHLPSELGIGFVHVVYMLCGFDGSRYLVRDQAPKPVKYKTELWSIPAVSAFLAFEHIKHLNGRGHLNMVLGRSSLRFYVYPLTAAFVEPRALRGGQRPSHATRELVVSAAAWQATVGATQVSVDMGFSGMEWTAAQWVDIILDVKEGLLAWVATGKQVDALLVKWANAPTIAPATRIVKDSGPYQGMEVVDHQNGEK